MKFTVVTISYKDEAGLAATVESVARQTYPAVEHIVIDGGSGPRVRALLADAPTVTQWVCEPDRGRYDAMNKGLERATGEYVWFLHSGDLFAAADTLERVAEALASEPAWGYGIAERFSRVRQLARTEFGEREFSMRKFALGGHPVPHQAAFFRRDVVAAVGPYDVRHGLAADQLWMLRWALVESPRVLSETVCLFDADGAGSKRPLRAHYDDMRRACNAVGYHVGGRFAHRLLSDLAFAKAWAGRRLRNRGSQ